MSAQEQVLGAVLVDPRHAATVLDRLTLEDFEPGWQQTVFQAFDDLYDASTDCTAANVLAHVISGIRDAKFGVWLAELYENAPIAPPIDAVIERTYRRAIWDATTRLRQGCAEWALSALLQTVDREFSGAMQAASRLNEQQPQSRPAGLSGLGDLLNGSTAA